MQRTIDVSVVRKRIWFESSQLSRALSCLEAFANTANCCKSRVKGWCNIEAPSAPTYQIRCFLNAMETQANRSFLRILTTTTTITATLINLRFTLLAATNNKEPPFSFSQPLGVAFSLSLSVTHTRTDTFRRKRVQTNQPTNLNTVSRLRPNFPAWLKVEPSA